MCNLAGTTQVNPISGALLGPTAQRSQIRTFVVAPTWTHLVNADTVLSLGAWLRHDQVNYYPSGNPFSDLGPLQDSLAVLQVGFNGALRQGLNETEHQVDVSRMEPGRYRLEVRMVDPSGKLHTRQIAALNIK